MANWRNLFKPWIIARGQEYFEWGQVTELEENSFFIQAQVSGSREYQVEIRRNGDRVTQMSCGCPYAAGGENCKHMAAVLIALEEESMQERMDWHTALAQLPEEKIRELLQSLAADDGTLQDRIIRMVSGPSNDPAQWQNDLDQIISDHTDYYGRLGYDAAYDCMVDIAEYLEECLPSLLDKGQVIDAAKLVMTVYGAAFGRDMDDSDGGLSIVSDTCRKALGQVIELADAQDERKIFQLLHEFLEEGDWVYGSDDLEELLVSLDWCRELQLKNLQWLDENLDSWRMHQRAELMERMGASREEVIAWWEQYRESDSAYRPLMKLYEESDLPKAIELVREKRHQEEIHWRIIDYTKTLLSLLEKSGEQAEYENELRHLVLDLKCQDTAYMSQLKKGTPPERWPSTFHILLSDAVGSSGRMRLYHFEGMYAELFKELTQHPDFGAFQGYEEDLRKWKPEQTLNLYTELLKREMNKACERKQYRHVAGYLYKLEAYPNGQSAAQALAAYWYVYHKNRPAMKDELQRAGYPQG